MTEHTSVCIRCGVSYDKRFLPEVASEEGLCDACYDDDTSILVKPRPATPLSEALDKIVRDAFNQRHPIQKPWHLKRPRRGRKEDS